MLKTDLLFVPLLLAFAPLSNAALIDDFSTPQGPLIEFGGDPGFLFDSVIGAGIITNQREIGVRASLADETDWLSVVVAGGAMTATPSAGIPLSQGTSVRFLYDSLQFSHPESFIPTSLDLTDGGLSDRFIVEIDSLMGFFSLTVVMIDQTHPGHLQSHQVISSPGTIVIPFSGLLSFSGGADPADAGAVAMDIFIASGATVTISNFCTGNGAGCVATPATVPEPETLMLLCLGLFLLGAHKVRYRSCRETHGV